MRSSVLLLIGVMADETMVTLDVERVGPPGRHYGCEEEDIGASDGRSRRPHGAGQMVSWAAGIGWDRARTGDDGQEDWRTGGSGPGTPRGRRRWRQD